MRVDPDEELLTEVPEEEDGTDVPEEEEVEVEVEVEVTLGDPELEVEVVLGDPEVEVGEPEPEVAVAELAVEALDVPDELTLPDDPALDEVAVALEAWPELALLNPCAAPLAVLPTVSVPVGATTPPSGQ